MKRSLFRKLRPANGLALLEQAVVLPVLFVLVLGAVDIHSGLQSYSALREGVRTSLRCVYTVNGSCLNISYAERTPVFRVYLEQPGGSDKLYGYSYFYEGEERYIEAPAYTLSDFSTRILQEAEYTATGYMHYAERRRFPSTGHRPNVLMTAAPLVSGNSLEALSYRYKESPGQTLPPSLAIAGGAQATVTSDNPTAQVGNPSFSVPITFQGIAEDCKRSSQLDKKGPPLFHAPSNASCGSQFITDQKVRAVIVVEGSSTNSDTDGSARVTLRLRKANQAPGSGIDLGGRAFSGNGGHSFVPRGLPLDYAAPDSIIVEYPELALYSDRTKVSIGENYVLDIELHHLGGGTAQWKLSGVKIFFPQVSIGSRGWQTCSSPLYPTQRFTPDACTLNPPAALPLTEVHVQVGEEPMIPDSQSALFMTASDELIGRAATEQALEDILRVEGSELPDWFEVESFIPVESHDYSRSCPAPGEQFVGDPNASEKNYGVNKEAGENGYISQSPEAMLICPPAADHFELVSDIQWSEVEMEFIHAPLPWIRSTCDQLEPPDGILPPQFVAFKKHSIGAIAYTGPSEQRIDTGPDPLEERDPNIMIQNDSRYNCTDLEGGFSVGSKMYDHELPELPNDSLFAHMQPELGCDWKDVVRVAAAPLGLGAGAWFLPSTDSQTTIELPVEPGECRTFWIDPGEGGVRTFLGEFPEPDLPEECNAPGARCSLEFVGFDGESQNSIEFNTDKAAQYFGFEEVRATLPRAQWNCTGADCVSIDVVQDGEEFVSQGAITAPMNLLLGQEVELRYSERRKWEKFLQ